MKIASVLVFIGLDLGPRDPGAVVDPLLLVQ